MKHRLAIIEDRQPVLDSLANFFTSSEHFELVFTANSMDSLVDIWDRQQLDLVLCDIGLPGKSGIEITWYIKKRASSVQVIMFTVFEDRDNLFQALCAGASGYLLKSTPLFELEARLLEVMRGGSVMSPQVARLVFEHFNPTLDRAEINRTEQLTPREIEIVTLLQRGAPTKQVAEQLFISVDTVKYHVRNIYAKLQVNSRAELILKYK
ncbi:response regulator transcription factor [Sphingobacterium alkalisoli]|uniref:Response regulator transcription factor n=1 Tax=Sphingobacterium alkalisoli TaxID=1874115 RepID=A0A4U0GQY1_9SPHI|nr:response regulator transcription factor [Sphingobacterium alkalisoli]TJY61345.1 response regulator transcription factor [Sphingobacterium alkalisoli]GGH30826.1 DNA-binding response regulator [Sphingobacterium alkalisoli]